MAEPRFSRVGAAILVAVLAVFVVAAALVAHRSNQEQERLTQETETVESITAVEDRMTAYIEVLYGVRAGFVDGPMDRSRFHTEVDSIAVDDRYPGVQVIGAAPIIPADDIDGWRAATEADVAASGLPYPVLPAVDPKGGDEVLPIAFIEPQVGNERAFGLNFLGEPNRQEAALRARDTGQPAATAPITLVQETGNQTGFLVMLPVYRKGAPTGTVDERRAAFEGVVYAAFRTGDLLDGIFGSGVLEVESLVDVASGQPLFTASPDTPPASDVDPDRVGTLEVAGREWQVQIEPVPSTLSGFTRATPWIILLGGLVVAVLVAALLAATRSARSRAAAMASAMTEELGAITEATTEGIITIDESSTIVAWNKGAAAMLGVDEAAILGRSITEVLPEDAREEFLRVAQWLRANPGFGSEGWTQRFRALRADGVTVPVEISVARWTARGHVYLTGFVRDQTERIADQYELHRTTNLLTAVMGAATEVSIIATDLDGTVTLFNAGAERLLGYRAEDVVGKMTPATFHEGSEIVERALELGLPPGFDVFVHAARRGEAECRRWTYRRSDGTQLPVELTVTPMLGDDDEMIGYIGIGVDITERVAQEEHREADLERERQAVAKLTELDRVKSDVVSTMSHELRTPLTSIIGFSELLSDELAEDDEGSGRLVAMINRNAQRLLNLVEDILTLSRIESGSFRLRQEPCDPTTVLRGAIDAVAPMAASREISIEASIEPGSTVLGDRLQIERVWINLINNAVKFSPDGSLVEVTSLREGDEVVTTVSDHGIGIPADEQDRLFDRFFRSRIAERESIAGTGLGLAIVAEIVARHGGTIAIDSVEGVGTSVTVRIPVVGAPPRLKQEAPA